MAPVLVQFDAVGNGGVWLGTPNIAFPASLAGGNALFSYGCARPNGCPAFTISTADTQGNSWTQLPVDNTSGNAMYQPAYTLSSSAGADTINYTGANFCGFTFDPCAIAAEIAGVTGFGSQITFTGTGTAANGSITTPSGTYPFAATSIHSIWFLTLMYFMGTSGSEIILAIPYTADAFTEDTVSGWQLQSPSNLHSGLYTTITTPTPPAKVSVFVGVGSSTLRNT